MEYRYRVHLWSAAWRATWIGSGGASIFGMGYILSPSVTGKALTGPGMLAALYGAAAVGVCVSAAMEYAVAARGWIRLTDESLSRHSPLRNWHVLWSDIRAWALVPPSSRMRHRLIGLFIRGNQRAVDSMLKSPQMILVTASRVFDLGLVARIRESESLIHDLEERLGSPSATGTRATGTRI